MLFNRVLSFVVCHVLYALRVVVVICLSVARVALLYVMCIVSYVALYVISASCVLCVAF